VHALTAAGVIAARLSLDIAPVDDVAEQFTLVGLRDRLAEMCAEPVVNEADIVERVALARQAAQQQEARPCSSSRPRPWKKRPRVGSGKVSG
jgi:hypothetical protein